MKVRCECRTCVTTGRYMGRFIVCPDCGDIFLKGIHHVHECTGSNEPGQSGSQYDVSAPKPTAQDIIRELIKVAEAASDIARDAAFADPYDDATYMTARDIANKAWATAQVAAFTEHHGAEKLRGILFAADPYQRYLVPYLGEKGN